MKNLVSQLRSHLSEATRKELVLSGLTVIMEKIPSGFRATAVLSNGAKNISEHETEAKTWEYILKWCMVSTRSVTRE